MFFNKLIFTIFYRFFLWQITHFHSFIIIFYFLSRLINFLFSWFVLLWFRFFWWFLSFLSWFYWFFFLRNLRLIRIAFCIFLFGWTISIFLTVLFWFWHLLLHSIHLFIFILRLFSMLIELLFQSLRLFFKILFFLSQLIPFLDDPSAFLSITFFTLNRGLFIQLCFYLAYLMFKTSIFPQISFFCILFFVLHLKYFFFEFHDCIVTFFEFISISFLTIPFID